MCIGLALIYAVIDHSCINATIHSPFCSLARPIKLAFPFHGHDMDIIGVKGWCYKLCIMVYYGWELYVKQVSCKCNMSMSTQTVELLRCFHFCDSVYWDLWNKLCKCINSVLCTNVVGTGVLFLYLCSALFFPYAVTQQSIANIAWHQAFCYLYWS